MQKETLSLLLDGENIDDDIIDALSNDRALQEDWHQYHLIRETLRGSLHETTLNLDIADRIALAIEAEPNVASQPTDKFARFKGWWQSQPWKNWTPSFSPVVQLGVAACTALMVIVGVQQFNQVPEEDNLPALNTVPIGITPAPAGYSADYFKQSSDLEQAEKNKILIMLRDYEQHRRTYVE